MGQRLDDEGDRAEEERVAEHLALHRVDAVAVAVGQIGRHPDTDQGRGRAPDQHPGGQAGAHGTQPPVPHGAERLEDCAVENVRPDRRRGVEVEEEDQDRRHQGAAAHPGHPDEQPGDEAGDGET